jgi:hypothetical protein
MILWTNDTAQNNDTAKGYNNEVPGFLPTRKPSANRASGATRTKTGANADARRLSGLRETVSYWTSITLALVAFTLLLALAPSVTGEAQETGAGQSSAWMGERLYERAGGVE